MSKLFGAFVVISALLSSLSTQASEGEWELSNTHLTNVEMAVALNKQTGHKMQVIILKNGSMMALVPAVSLWDLLTACCNRTRPEITKMVAATA